MGLDAWVFCHLGVAFIPLALQSKDASQIVSSRGGVGMPRPQSTTPAFEGLPIGFVANRCEQAWPEYTKRVLSDAGLFGLDPDSRQITEEMTTQLSPEAIGVIAAEAEQRDSCVVDKISEFYSQHTEVVSKLGAHAVATVMRDIAQRASRDLDLWLTIQSDSVRGV
jgi:hypothetical protein